MFTLLSIQQTAEESIHNIGGEKIRCIILADNMSDELPLNGEGVVGMHPEQTFLPGTIAVTTTFNCCMVGNDGKWGAWS